MIYLYVKTHNKTGLKYLGKTEQDPFVYLGSGKRWLNHLNKHGVISEKAKIRRANGFKPVEKHTKETKEKMSLTRKGVKRGPYKTYRGIPLVDGHLPKAT